MRCSKWSLGAASLFVLASAAAPAAETADAKAARIERSMSDAERFQLLVGIMPINVGAIVVDPEIHKRVPQIAGYVPGVPRLGVPELLETDASLGVADPRFLRKDKTTAMPSGLAMAATFDPALMYKGGALIGAEARALGYNVLLAGGVNLARDPRNGRNFEYLGEDPLLSGIMGGAAIRGIQSQGVLSTIKHFALNAQETLRKTLDARIDEAALRESDLLAFQLAIELGHPASVMCAYNLVNGAYACGNDHLLNTVLKRDWGYPGFVMSDWGAVHDVSYFNAGLDQESGSQIDARRWFDAPLKAEVAAGKVSHARLSDAVRRILRSYYAVGIDAPRTATAIDYDQHAATARQVAAAGIVLLKNDGVLPLAASAKSIAIIGGFAQLGVMSGGGSSQVVPVGGPAAIIPLGGPGMWAVFGSQLIVPSSPLQALQAQLPKTVKVGFNSGYSPEAAAAEAARAQVAIVFATQWQGEALDSGSLTLAQGQDRLIAAVAKANPNTVVVLETGNPVRMPWLRDVKAVVEAWYPGQKGGEAIADVLTGAVSPSGRLPMSFPVDETQNPRPVLPGYGAGLTDQTKIAVYYREGAEVGYRWFAAKQLKPLFPFGHGLSYTNFVQSGLKLSGTRSVMATFTVRNTGPREGADVPQLYLVSAAGERLQRLVAFQKVRLAPGETRTLRVAVDPRLLAHWDTAANGWRIRPGDYRFAMGESAGALGESAAVRLAARFLTDAQAAGEAPR